MKTAASLPRIRQRGGDNQLDLRASPLLAPDLQFSPDPLRAFAHTPKTEMSFVAFLTEHLRIDTDSVVPQPDPKLPRIVPDFNFDLPRLRVVERVAQRFVRNPVDLVPQDRMQVLRGALHFQGKSRCVPGGISSVCGELLTYGFNCISQVILGSCG